LPSRAVAGIDLHNPPAVLIRTFWEVYKETFDYLYLREAPAFLGLTLHCHFGGRPLVCAVFDRILKYIAQFPDVWFASHGEIARWTLDENIEAETYGRRIKQPQA
jgi:allantoinase